MQTNPAVEQNVMTKSRKLKHHHYRLEHFVCVGNWNLDGIYDARPSLSRIDRL